MRIIVFIFMFLVSNSAYGDEQVASIAEGEPAPFDGTLFNIEAAARILVELENADEACQIKIDHELGIQQAELDLTIANLDASLAACNSICEERIQIYRDQSLYFQEELTNRKSWHPAWGFVGGVLLGSGITIGITYAVSNALEN